MNHENMLELLPFRANGTLSNDQSKQVDEHLAGCPDCRQELENTHLAASIYAAHPSPDQLWQLAEGEEFAPVVAQHAAACASCAEELAMIRDSQAALAPETPAKTEGKVVRGPWGKSPLLRFALAAGLALAVLGPVLLMLSKGGTQVAGKVVDLPVAVMRGGDPEPADLKVVHQADGRITLTLGANKPGIWTGVNDVVVELIDEAGRELLRKRLSVDVRIGAVQIPLDAGKLPLGVVTVSVYSVERELLAETRFQVEP